MELKGGDGSGEYFQKSIKRRERVESAVFICIVLRFVIFEQLSPPVTWERCSGFICANIRKSPNKWKENVETNVIFACVCPDKEEVPMYVWPRVRVRHLTH